MRTLHVFKDDRHLAAFPLPEGSHLLGISQDADLLVGGAGLEGDVCYVEVAGDGTVELLALPEVTLHAQSGEHQPSILLRNGHHAEAACLTLTLLDIEAQSDVRIDEPRAVPLTERSPLLHPPPQEPYSLLVTTERGSTVVPLDGSELLIGRDPACNVRIAHKRVSARHAKITFGANGWWIDDQDSTNGTFVHGKLVKSSAFKPHEKIHLSSASDAPILELITTEEGLMRTTSAGALIPLVGDSKSMKALLADILLYGPRDEPVLIRGETGTGKELVAKALAQLRRGNDKTLVVQNGGDAETGMFGSDLFGHRKGAFTGAVSDHRGRFEAAGHGTVFFDEIGELPLELQSKLLRVLQERTVQRRGENQERPIHCRIVFATHRNLEAMVQAGTFRADLLARIDVLRLTTPPLRDRVADLPKLCEAILQRKNHHHGLMPEALQKLAGYSWPLNIRELEHVLERAAVRVRDLAIPAEAIELPEAPGGALANPALTVGTGPQVHSQAEIAERAACQRAMAASGNKIRRAADIVGIKYTSFYRRLKRYGLLPKQEVVNEEPEA